MIIESIAIAPVKGLGLNHPTSVEVTETGVHGDRRYALVDDRGLMVNGKRQGTLIKVKATTIDDPESLTLEFPDGSTVSGEIELGDSIDAVFFGKIRPARAVLGDYSAALSKLAGESLRLVRLPDGDAIDRPDVGDVSLQSVESLEALGREAGLEGAVDGRRFRMTFTVSGAGEHAEDSWIGKRVRIGSAILAPEGNIGRCVVTTHDPNTGVTDLETLKILARYRGELDTTEPIAFGIHARVVEPGLVSIGDEVTVEA
jgi:uncharacterized protein